MVCYSSTTVTFLNSSLFTIIMAKKKTSKPEMVHIIIPKSTRETLKKLKQYKKESYWSVIERLMDKKTIIHEVQEIDTIEKQEQEITTPKQLYIPEDQQKIERHKRGKWLEENFPNTIDRLEFIAKQDEKYQYEYDLYMKEKAEGN